MSATAGFLGSRAKTETESETVDNIVDVIEPPVFDACPPITEQETEIEEEYKYLIEWADYEITQSEFELICTTVFCEAGGQTLKLQNMVALTILNQIVSGKFGDSVYEVIYKKNNFAVTQWDDFENRGWSDRTVEAVMLALRENKHPKNMYYFRTNHYHTWAKNYKRVGNVYFSTHK